MRLSTIALTLLLLSGTSALADDWTVVRVRGGVFALDSGQWVQLLRNSVVSDDRIVKSAPGGRATFVRGAETIEVGGDTTIQIDDTKRGFTTVYEHAGTVGVDAEARNVQHFAVQTPFVAAVVKGTAFVVETGRAASVVAVSRGTVAVHDEHFGTDVAVAAGSAVASGNEPVTAASLMAIPAALPKPPAPAARQPAVAAIGAGNGEAGRGRGEDGPGKSAESHGKGHGNSSSSGNKSDDSGPGNSDKGHGNGNSGNGSGNSSNGSSNGNSGNSGHGNSGEGNSSRSESSNSSSHGKSGK